MTLHMLQICPDMERLVRWAHGHGLLRAANNRLSDDLGYALHATMHAAFGKQLAPKPFALIQRPRREPQLLAYSAAGKAELRDQAAAFAEPEIADRVLRLSEMADKRMPDTFAPGHRLGFAVRVRPMLRTDKDGNRGRSREIDAFLAEALRDPSNRRLDRGEIYAAWLAERLRQGGAVPERLTLAAFRRTRVLRRSGLADRRLMVQEGPDASFEGVLSVADPGAFTRLLARGVGRHRAFGFGMLLLRPC